MSGHAACNRAYSLVWCDAHSTYVAVPEGTRRRGKAGRSAVALAALTIAGAALADPAVLPSGGRITAGSASIGSAGSTLTITQGSARTAIEWNRFSIGSGAKVDFVQPNASSIALNRVVGSEASVIDGALNANGQVFLLNPNGVLVGRGGRVDTAGFVASTLNLSDSDFMAGRTSFSATGTKGSVVNLGTIVSKGGVAKDGGYAALLGNQVRNEGTITAKLGTAVLAAGDRVSLNFNGDSLVGVTVDQATLGALVENKNAILADGGLVVLTAKGLDTVLANVVNNTGEIRARTIADRGGKIYLLGEGGAVNVAGTLDASAPAGGHGGFVETSGPKVRIADGTKVDTHAARGDSGNWLIDPFDFTIAASGGDITGSTLSSNLAAGSVTIQSTSGTSGTNGDVNVDAAVAWSSNNTLTLNAVRNININAPITSSGATGRLTLQYGQGAVASGNTADYSVAAGVKVGLAAGANLQTKLGSDGTPLTWTVLTALGAAGSGTGSDLQGIAGAASGNFALGADIDASPTANWNSGAGFAPIAFSGQLAGLGHSITQLTINRPTTDQVALFGTLGSGAVVRDVRMTGVAVTGRYNVGGLAGMSDGNVTDSSVAGTVAGDTGVGALIGSKMSGTVARSTASGTVSASGTGQWIGGLVGYNGYQSDIVDSSAAVSVTGQVQVGGLLGYNDYGNVRNSFATGPVSGATSYVGGLVGVNNVGTVSTSYATGAVSGNAYVGGLVGQNDRASVVDSYAMGAVSGTGGSVHHVGGLVGGNVGSSATITDSYAAGTLTPGVGATSVGGLAGSNAGTVSNSFWDSSVAGSGSANGIGTAKTTAEMNATSTFLGAGWNFTLGTGVWGRRDDLNSKYPVLRTFGYTDRIGLIAIAPDFFANPNAALSYTASGLLAGDAMTLTQSGSTLNYAFNNPGRAGFYDALVVRSQATTGDLTIARPIALNNFKLTLEAAGDLQVNAPMSVTGSATLDLKAGYNFNAASPAFDATKTVRMGFNPDRTFAGRVDIDRTGTGILTIDNEGYTLVNALGAAGSTTGADLQGMGGALTGRFALAGNIDATATAGWNSGAGFVPIGATGNGTAFTGRFDGLGHTVSNLSITDALDTGLFGAIGGGAALRNLALTGATVNAARDAAVLVGRYFNPSNTLAWIDNVHVAGSLTATNSNIGGLVGNAYQAANLGNGFVAHLGTLAITNASAAVQITRTGTAGSYFGGLTGNSKNLRIANSFATGAVSAPTAGGVGGLAGYLEDSTVDGSYATGTVTGSQNVGGLVGEWYAKTAGSTANVISNSRASGNVSSTDTSYSYTGGLLGDVYHNAGSLQIVNSHASGNVTAALAAGGLLGGSEDGLVTITGSDASGNVTSTLNSAGGLVGTTAGGTISNSQASGAVHGFGKSGGLVGLMQATALSASSATGNVTGTGTSGAGAASQIGGLVGQSDTGSTITTSSASGNVTGRSDLGGLVGSNGSYNGGTGSITASSASGAVTSTSGDGIGGLVGTNFGTIARSSATGSVTANGVGSAYIGGLVGLNYQSASVTDAYARGNVAASANAQGVGGLVGDNESLIANAYSTGTVAAGSGGSDVGGLVGYNSTFSNVAVTNSFWDTQTSGMSTSGAGTPKTTAEMTANALYTGAGWNFTPFTGTWARRDDLNDKYPVLRALGYTDRIGAITLAPSFLAAPGAALSYTTSGLLAGDTMTLTRTGNTLSYAFNNPGRTGFYDGFAVRAQALTGDLTIARPIAWNNFKLTLEAAGDVNVNALLTVAGAGQLDVRSGYNFNAAAPTFDATKNLRLKLDTAADGTPSFTGKINFGGRTGTDELTINGNAYMLIASLGAAGSTTGTDLQGLNGARAGNFALSSDIDMSTTAGWNGGAGWTPIGSGGTPFTGRFQGLGRTLSGLHLAQTTNVNSYDGQGLFGVLRTALVGNVLAADVDLVNVSYYTGAIAGRATSGTQLVNVAATGSITGSRIAGGIVGEIANTSVGPGRVSGAVFKGDVTATDRTAGGIVGSGYGDFVGGNPIEISDVTSTATVRAIGNGEGRDVGGIAGYLGEAVVRRATAHGTVSGKDSIGGLVGFAEASRIENSQAVGSQVSGRYAVGGVTGQSFTSDVTESRAVAAGTGSVSGQASVGGLIGSMGFGTVARSYADMPVSYAAWTGSGAPPFSSGFGGLIGSMSDSYWANYGSWSSNNVYVYPTTYLPYVSSVAANFVTDAYARGAVAAGGATKVGGLIGEATSGTVTRTYATGAVAGAQAASTGGLVGVDAPASAGNTVWADNFWDAQTTGQTRASGGGALAGVTSETTAQMNTTGTFNGAGPWNVQPWDFTFRTGTWGRKDSVNDKYPVLRTFGFVDALTLTLAGTTKSYGDANPTLGALTAVGCPTAGCVSATWGSALGTTTGVGSYAYSGANVLNLVFANGYSASDFEIALPTAGLTITPRLLTVTAAPGAGRTYDGTTSAVASLFTLGNLVNGDSLGLVGSAVLASKNAGAQTVAGAGSLALTSANPNYTLGNVVPAGTVTIAPRVLHVGFNVAGKVFDGSATTTATTTDDRIAGDQLTIVSGFAFGNQNVGTAKPVTATSLALTGADAANYAFATSTGTGLVADLNARPLTYTLTASTANLTATGQPLYTTATIDRLVLAAWSNAVAGTPPGALAYTIWRGGQQVAAVDAAGTYEIRAQFAAADAHYAIAGAGNTPLTLTVAAAPAPAPAPAPVSTHSPAPAPAATPSPSPSPAPTTPAPAPSPATTPVPPVLAAAAGSPLDEVIAAAVSTAVAQSALATDAATTNPVVAAQLGGIVERPRAEFNPAAPNVVNPLAALAASFGPDTPLSIVSSPRADEPTESVTLGQARRMTTASPAPGGPAQSSTREVRVPVSRNSLAEIVNGGVKLPGGVDQLLFVVKAK